MSIFDPPIRTSGVRLRRVVVDLDDVGLAFDLHERLTVIAAKPAHVEAILDLVEGSATTSTPGIHLEFDDAVGRRLLLFRPHGGAQQVLCLHSGRVVEDPVFDLPELVFRPEASGDDQVVLHLGSQNQDELWAAAEMLAIVRAAEGFDVGVPAEEGDPRSRWLGHRHEQAPDTTSALAALDQAEAHWAAFAGATSLERALELRPIVAACAMVCTPTPGLEAVRRSRATQAESFCAEVTKLFLLDILGGPAQPRLAHLPSGAMTVPESRVALDALVETGSDSQIIVVTSDDEIAEWGRLEAIGSRSSFVDLTSLVDRC